MSSKKTGKVKDTWREKKWYTVTSPPYFGNIELANIPANSPDEITGRIVETTLYEVTGDVTHQSIHLYFQVDKIDGRKALTTFRGHELARDYVRSLIRRGTSRVDGIFNATTKDGYLVRLAVTAFTTTRSKTSQEMLLRSVMGQVLRERAQMLTYDEFVQQSVLGKIASDIYNVARKILPLRKIEIRKSKLVSAA